MSERKYYTRKAGMREEMCNFGKEERKNTKKTNVRQKKNNVCKVF